MSGRLEPVDQRRLLARRGNQPLGTDRAVHTERSLVAVAPQWPKSPGRTVVAVVPYDARSAEPTKWTRSERTIRSERAIEPKRSIRSHNADRPIGSVDADGAYRTHDAVPHIANGTNRPERSNLAHRAVVAFRTNRTQRTNGTERSIRPK